MSSLAFGRSLTRSCDNLNLARPTPQHPATWGAQPTTAKGRKPLIESLAHINIANKTLKKDEGVVSPRTRHAEIRKMRMDDIKNQLTSASLENSIEWEDVKATMEAADTGQVGARARSERREEPPFDSSLTSL